MCVRRVDGRSDRHQYSRYSHFCIKEGVYRIWCGVITLGDSCVNTHSDTSAFVSLTVQLLLTRRGKIRMDGVGIVFEFYIYSPSLSNILYITVHISRNNVCIAYVVLIL